MAQDNPHPPFKIAVTGEQPAIVTIDSSLEQPKREAMTYIRATDFEVYQVTTSANRVSPSSRDPGSSNQERHPGLALGFSLGAVTVSLVVAVLGYFWSLKNGVAPDRLGPILNSIVEPLVTALIGIASGATATYIALKRKKD